MLLRTLLLWLLLAVPAYAQVDVTNLPANSVVGRLGNGVPGPAEAIPLSVIEAASSGISIVNGIPYPSSWTANLPILGNGTSEPIQGTVSGNTTTFATTNGSLTNGHCVSIDANGNFVDAGGSCTTGGGGGTVNSGTANQITYYASSGAAVSGLTAGTAGQALIEGSPPAWGLLANAGLANMNGGTIKGNNGGSAAAPSDLTGAQAEALLKFTQTGTGAVQRTLDAKVKDVISALDFAVGDCSTDDSTAIQDAINATPNGGMLFFPPAPGGCYAIGSGTAITLPSAATLTIMCASQGDASTSAWKATTNITAMIKSNTTFTPRGIRITNCTFLGNQHASYGLEMSCIDGARFDNLLVYDTKTTAIILGNNSCNVQNNIIENIQIDSPLATASNQLPTYGLEMDGVTNNYITNVKSANAQTANFYDAANGAQNVMNGVHGYNFFNGSAGAATYCFLLDGSGSQLTNFECDGAGTAAVQVNGFDYYIAGGYIQFQNVTAEKGIVFASSGGGSVAVGNYIANSTIGNSVVEQSQDWAFFNENVTNGALQGLSNGTATVNCASGISASTGQANYGLVTHC